MFAAVVLSTMNVNAAAHAYGPINSYRAAAIRLVCGSHCWKAQMTVSMVGRYSISFPLSPGKSICRCTQSGAFPFDSNRSWNSCSENSSLRSRL